MYERNDDALNTEAPPATQRRRFVTATAVAVGALGSLAALAAPLPQPPPPARAANSPWGVTDEIGRLNMMTDASRAAVLGRVGSGKAYDLGVEYFVGMPSWSALGDPTYQFWMTHTPQGTVNDDPMRVGRAMNQKVSYTGDAVSMYTHTGTHIDALNHFGLHDHIWNGYRAEAHLGDRGWTKAGAETIPPVIARGVLIDVAAARGVETLGDSYGITAQDLQQALAKQRVSVERGDVVLVRTGRMRKFRDARAYMESPPGLTLGAARWLVDDRGAMVLGGDNLSLETFPVETPDNWIPVHTWLLAERGVPILEVVDLEALARDRVYEFAFIAASLKLRGASGAPMRPVALPLRAR